MPHRPSFAASRSLCLALMTSTARTVTVETKAARRREAANCMIVTLSVCVSQRSDIVSYRCRKVLVLLETKWLPVWVRWGADFCVPIVERAAVSVNTFGATMSGVSLGVLLWSRHHSESPVCARMAGLLSAHFVLAGILPPIHCGPHWHARRAEKKNERTISSEGSERKGCHAMMIFSLSCPFRIWLVFRWFLCGRLIDFLPFQSAKQWSVVATSIKSAEHSQPKEIAAAASKDCTFVWWGGWFISSHRRHFRFNINSLMKPQGENCYLSTGPIPFPPSSTL